MLLCLTITMAIFSQELSYLINNFDFQKLESELQSCSAVVEDTLGLILCTSSNRLLSFDGKEWIIREFDIGKFLSLYRDKSGSIWYGAIHDFGRVIRSVDYGFELESHALLLPDSLKLFGSILSIVEYDSSFFFHGSSYIFRLKGGEVSAVRNSSRFSRGFLVNSHYYTNHDQRGLLRYSSGRFAPVAGGEAFKDKIVVGMAALSPDSLIIGTRTDGLFLLIPSSGESLLWPAGEPKLMQVLGNTRLQHLISLPGDKFVFSTTDYGSIITTRDGEITKRLNGSSGSNTNRHNYSYIESSNRLWMCTDQGLSTYSLNSPFYIWDASKGIEGAAVVSSCYDEQILVGTYNGLYLLTDPLHAEGKIERLLNIPSWGIADATLDNSLEVKLVCTQDGLFMYRNNTLQLLFRGNVYKTIQLNRDNRFFITVGLSGLHAFSMKGGRIDHYQLSEYAFTDISSLVQDDNYIWITYGSTGKSFRIRQQEVIDRLLNNDLRALEFTGVSTDHPLEAFNIDRDKYIFSSVDGFLEYDSVSHSFVRLRSWGKDVEDYSGKVTNMSKDLKGNIWLGGNIILIDNYDGTYNLSRMNLEILSGRSSSTDIYHDDKGRSWILDERGVILIDHFDQDEREVPEVIITKAVFTDLSAHYIYKSGIGSEHHDDLSFRHSRKLSLNYTIPYPYSARQVDYSYRMDGPNTQWSAWSSWSNAASTTFNNLKSGRYTFWVKARFENRMETGPSSISFTVARSWYDTLFFKMLFLAFTLLIVVRLAALHLKNRDRRELELKEAVNQKISESFLYRLADKEFVDKAGLTRKSLQSTHPGETVTEAEELFIEKFVSLVEEHMSDSQLSVEKLAEMLNISQKMLYRRVKSATGVSVKAFIRKVRLKNAAILLSKYDLTVAEVAYKVGYNHPSYFTKSFSTEFNKTPLQFQKEARGNIGN